MSQNLPHSLKKLEEAEKRRKTRFDKHEIIIKANSKQMKAIRFRILFHEQVGLNKEDDGFPQLGAEIKILSSFLGRLQLVLSMKSSFALA